MFGDPSVVVMTSIENKKLLADIFEQMSLGNTRALSDAMVPTISAGCSPATGPGAALGNRKARYWTGSCVH